MTRRTTVYPKGAGAPGGGVLRRCMHRLHGDERGAISTEYMLILALVVLPIALLFPVFMQMIRIYAGRMISLAGLPIP